MPPIVCLGGCATDPDWGAGLPPTSGLIVRFGQPLLDLIVHIGATSDMTGTTPVYTSGDPNNPGPPDATIGATPTEDSSYLNQPPPFHSVGGSSD